MIATIEKHKGTVCLDCGARAEFGFTIVLHGVPERGVRCLPCMREKLKDDFADALKKLFEVQP